MFAYNTLADCKVIPRPRSIDNGLAAQHCRTHPTPCLFRGINLRKSAEQIGGSSRAEVKWTYTEVGMYALRY